MSVRSRFNIIVLLGLLFAGLVFHNLASTRIGIIIERESTAYLLGRLPGGAAGGIGAAVLGVLLLLLVMVFANRRLGRRRSRRMLAKGRFVTVPLGALFLTAGFYMVREYPRHPMPQELSGVVAVIVGLSLLFFSILASRRSLLVAHGVLLVAVVVVAASFRFHPAHREKVTTLEERIDIAMDHLERRRGDWAMASPDEVMLDARRRAEQREVYRFDEHLDDMIDLKAPQVAADGGVLFDMPRDGRFVEPRAGGAKPEIQGRRQVFLDYHGGTLLRTEQPLDLEWSEIGSFVITMKVSRGSYFQVFWGNTYEDRNSIRIPLGAPGRPASYEIKERIIRYQGEGKVGHIWIKPSDRDARVEIESFQALDRTNAVLKGVPFGVGYENVDAEIRKVLLVSTPTELTFRVPVPRNRPRLDFGVGTSNQSTPTTFEVSIGRGENKQVIFYKRVSGEPRWYDQKIPLSSWAGRTILLTFKTTASEQSLGFWSNPVLWGERSENPNVVIYLVDALRADHMSAYGYDRNTTPVLDSLCAKGTLFERVTANGTTTKYTMPSLFTSNPISSTGVRHQADVLPDEFPTLAEVFRTMGYATASFLTNDNAGVFSGSHQGFSRLFTRLRILREAEIQDAPIDSEVLIGDLLQGWIRDNADRNFFLYVHTVDVHAPYDPPQPYRHYYEALGPGGTPVARDPFYDARWVENPSVEGRRALYDGEIEYNDLHFGRFLGMLEDAGVLDNTVIIFTSDHGEFLGERGEWGHHTPMFIQATNIPLFILGPGFPAGVRVPQTAQILDIMPTALDAAGVPPDPILFQGKSLLPLAHGESRKEFSDRIVFVEAGHPGETAFYAGRFHVIPEKNLIFDISVDPPEEVYFNEFLLDFGVKGMSRELVKEYLDTYAALHDVVAPSSGGVLEVDPETLKKLRALGYIQ